jgi:hydroxyacylglutathione hydrolase
VKEPQPDGKTQATVRPEPPKIVEIRPSIYHLQHLSKEIYGSHVYLIKGRVRNALIDTGTASQFPALSKQLSEVGLGVGDIHLVLLTHEHGDHIGATTYFHKTAVVAAHRLTANKLELQDEFVTFNKYLNAPDKPFWVDIWLEDGNTIDFGEYKLRVVHTPGHTSGCICLYESEEGLLFSGDTVFAGGTLSDIATSGNVSDYVNSVQRLSSLKIKQIYPGHGKPSNTPDEDLKKALIYAQTLLNDSKMFFESFIKTRQLQEKDGYWKDAEKSAY